MEEYKVIGGSPVRKDAYEKVTGEAKYSADFHPAGMLFAKLKYSEIPHGIIKKIDTSRAEALPGVVAVLTGRDVPEKRGGGYLKDKHLLCREKVRFVGDSVAAVAAVSEAIAEKAVQLIEVEYEELPAVFDPVEAFRKDCKVVLHEDLKNYEQSWMVNGAFYMDDERPNQYINRPLIHGDIDKGFAESEVIIEHTYTFPRASHCYLEPDVCVAIPGSDGEITTYSSEQMGSPGKNEICEQFELSASKVHYNIPYVGGGFGGKTGTPCEGIAVLLAMKTGRPVRLLHTRAEAFINGSPRSSAVIVVKDGYKKDGTLMARKFTEYVNAGAYSEHCTPLITCGPYAVVGSYRIPNLKVDCYGIFTNTPPTGPYRALGGEMIGFAVDRNMEYAAAELGMSSVELRMKNLLNNGDIDGCGMVTFNNSAKEAFAEAVKYIEPDKKREPDGPWVYGKGVSVANKFGNLKSGQGSQSTCKLLEDGTIEVRSFHVEIGQGARTVDAMIAAEAMKVPVEKIRIVAGNSDTCPFDEGTYSSRGTYCNGNGILAGIEALKKRIYHSAAPLLQVPEDRLDTAGGRVFSLDDPEKSLDFTELFEWAGFVRDGGEMLATATWNPPYEYEDPATGQGNLVEYYSHGSWGIEVAVNRETGEVRIEKAGGWYDGGTIINYTACEAQIEGAFSMGYGQALYEEILSNDRGRVINGNFRDYKMPTFMDMPKRDALQYGFIDNPLETGPFGAKGIGEISLIPVLPALANAIRDALGIELDSIPMTRERILEAIHKAEQEKGSGACC